MNVSTLVFRFRYPVHTLIFGLGLFSPWNRFLHLDPPGTNAHVWGLLATNLAKVGAGSLAQAFDVILLFGIVLASVGAGLRIWGDAYLGGGVVKDSRMHIGAIAPIISDGPFAHVRNPLYLGTFCHTLALSLLMARSGALFAICTIAALQLWMIMAEERFLEAKLGAPYKEYMRNVPRLIPSLRARLPGSGLLPKWAQAFTGEIYFWGVALCFVLFGRRYDAALLLRCVVVCFGAGLIGLALTPKVKADRS